MAGANAGGGNNRNCEGEPIANPQLNARIHLHRSENTRSMLRETVLPAVGGGSSAGNGTYVDIVSPGVLVQLLIPPSQTQS